MQAQRQMRVEHALTPPPLWAENLIEPSKSLSHGVLVHVQLLRARGDALARLEKGQGSLDVRGASRFIVLDERADGVTDDPWSDPMHISTDNQ